MHRGEYLKNLIKTNGETIVSISKGTGIGRTTLHRYINDENLKIDKIVRIAQFLKVDISEEIEGAQEYIDRISTEETFSEDVKNITIYAKYMDLIEKYTKLQDDYIQLQKENKALETSLQKRN